PEEIRTDPRSGHRQTRGRVVLAGVGHAEYRRQAARLELRQGLGGDRQRAQAVRRRHHAARGVATLHQRLRSDRRRVRSAATGCEEDLSANTIQMSLASHSSVEAERPYLHLQGLSKVYATRDGAVRALDQVSVSEKRGEFLSIVGPSGCGKSTLLMIAAGLLPASSGAVTIDGERVSGPRTDIGIVFLSPVLL